MASTGSSTSAYQFGATSGYRTEGDAGLTLVGCRFYDAQVGRFITRDTYLDQAPYAYCDGDPVNAVDPSGHDWRDIGEHLGETALGILAAIAILSEGVTITIVIAIGVGLCGASKLGDEIAEKIESWPGPPEDAPEPDPAHQLMYKEHEDYENGNMPKGWE